MALAALLPCAVCMLRDACMLVPDLLSVCVSTAHACWNTVWLCPLIRSSASAASATLMQRCAAMKPLFACSGRCDLDVARDSETSSWRRSLDGLCCCDLCHQVHIKCESTKGVLVGLLDLYKEEEYMMTAFGYEVSGRYRPPIVMLIS